ncbi:MAG: bifunctional hydroxymethylpyrimidine kinase/phosphomethylpyrimidine kinase [Rhodospirillaceae bacterium]|nr:bifunctional hydroxymethylpyrimidine kinase/phosphomethylpyrimidine kinase [Rhodospirillaceae bacterium]
MRGRVLIIAGSDSGGGAGIQADIKTVTALDAFAMTAVTAITVQNTKGVFGVHPIPVETITQQIEAVMADLGADVIKTGMLATVDVIEAVADCLARVAPKLPRVIDPVMRAKGGYPLLADDAAQCLIRRLVRGATVVTPNLPEAEVLVGRSIKTETDMRASVDAMRALGAEAVLLKGGHLEGERVLDLLITRDGVTDFADTRIHTRSTHGTGCTLASAIAAGLAQGLGLEAAVTRARGYVREAIETAPGYGSGHGPLNHAHTVTNL